MTASVSRTKVDGFEAVVLENAHMRAVVLPELGGRVWTLEDLVRSRQWIWHRPGVPLRRSRAGEPYDDVWAGGWEELFPNDAPGEFEGRWLADHGEWWTLPWTVEHESSGAEARLRLTTASAGIRARCVKEFVLRSDQPTLAVRYQIESEEPEAFHFLFKQHLPIQLTDSCRLVMPGGRVLPVDPAFGTLLQAAESLPWPANAPGSNLDLRVVPASTAAAREFVYVSDLPAGWCGVVDPNAKASLRMNFDRAVFPYVWLFLSYGGWRDVYTAVLEPCTNMPKELTDAVRLGQSARMAPGGVWHADVSVTLDSDRALAD